MNAPHDVDLAVQHGLKTTLFSLPDKDTDHVQRFVYRHKSFYELEMLEHMAARIAPDSLVLDVGAYVGTHTLFLANVCGARVHAFEPNPRARAVLERNVRLNDLEDRVDVRALALGAEAGSGRLVAGAPANLGQARVLPGGDDVAIARLDDLGFREPIAAIKIDVEGSELAVLRGAEQLLRVQQPLLYVECATLDALADVADFLSTLGYAAGAHFNATPTISFHPGTASLSGINVQIALHQHATQRRFERLHGELASVTQKLEDSARVHVRDHARLTQLISDSSPPPPLAPQPPRLEDRLEQALASGFAQLTGALEGVRREAAERAEQQAHALRSLESQARDLQQRIERVATAVQQHTRRLEREKFTSRLGRKLRKLARDPEQFLADSRHELLHVTARRAYQRWSPTVRAVLTSPTARKLRKLSRRPDAFLHDAKSPLLRSLGRSLSPWLAHGGDVTSSRASAQRPRVTRSTAVRTAPDLRATETSLIVLVPECTQENLRALRGLAGLLRPTDELIVLAPQPASEAPELGRWADALCAPRARLYLHYAEFDETRCAAHGLEHARGSRCVLLTSLVPGATRLCELLLHSAESGADVARFADGSLALVAAHRTILREQSWLESESLLEGLRRSARAGGLPLREQTVDGSRQHFGERRGSCATDLLFGEPGRESQLAEELVARRPSRPHVYAANAEALLQSLPDGFDLELTLIDLRQVPSFFVYALPDASRPLTAAQIVCLERRPGWALPRAAGSATHTEKVSVVMTACNAERTIDAAMASVLRQSHVNLELIVVDDCSSDGTLERIQARARSDRRVRVLRTPRNMGAAWSTNLGLTQARGKFIAFQGADEIALSPRLELSLSLLKAMPDRSAVAAHAPPITDRTDDGAACGGLVCRRSLLQKVGYFDSVLAAAEEELLARIAASGEKLAQLPFPYHVRRRADDAAPHAPGASTGTAHVPSVSARERYLAAASRWHAEAECRGQPLRIEFPLRVRPFEVPDQLLVAPPSERPDLVVASMATMPSRLGVLAQTVASLLPQVDQLNVYLNNFDAVPDFLRQPKIRIARSQDHGDLRDNGKFFFARDLPSGYHLTVDDDIKYPPDYVQASILAVERYARRAVVGVHGVNLDPELKRYTKGRQVFHFEHAQAHDRFVQLLGTGTVAYHTSTLRIELGDFATTGVADLWFAAAAKRQGVPLVSQRRRHGWLVPLEHGGATIFASASRNDTRETQLARSLGPWHDAAFSAVHAPLVRSLTQAASYGQLEASGYDLHTIARIDERPRVRIVLIVPGWNCAEHVERCWRSIVRQQPGHYELELVLIDDGSSDGTAEALERAMAALPLPARHACRVVRHAQNRGPAYSRWEAIQLVEDRNAVLAFLDMDDELLDSALARVAQAYLADERCWMTVGNWQNQRGRLNPLDFYVESVIERRAYRRTREFRLGHLRSFKRFLAEHLREELFRGPDGEWLMYCTDVALLLPLIERCAPENIRRVQEPIYLYNERREGGTLERFGKERKRELYRWICARGTESSTDSGVTELAGT